MLNPFFLQGSNTEQNLIQDLINESIKMYGIDVYYLPRQCVTTNTVIREVIESKFQNAFPIEAYVESYDGYNNIGTLMSKFGIQELDDLVLIISKDRFETYIQPLIKDVVDIKISTRPKEGDLIYFPLGDRLFEIKYVEHEKPFYQLQKNYVYQLNCELFRYENESIITNVDFVDDNVKDQGYIQTLTLVGSATSETATATASIVNGGVRRVRVTNRGKEYTSVPVVAFSSAPFGGQTAAGIASMISDIIDCNGVVSSKVQAVNLTNSGFGYTVAPMVSFVGGGGSGASAVAEIADGIVGVISVTDGGSGYTIPPIVTISPPQVGVGETAIAVSVINAAGSVTAINIVDSGIGYTTIPTITIESPTYEFFGTYQFNETIIGESSNTTAVINSWDSSTNILRVSKITGSFIVGETIVGAASSARRKLSAIQTFDIPNPEYEENQTQDPNYNISDAYAQNYSIQMEADNILDFSEKNPFGMP